MSQDGDISCTMWCTVLLVTLNLSVALSIESRFDEYLWTKDSWKDFKYQKPRDRWRVEDDPLVARQTHPLRQRSCDFISTDGPGVPRRDAVDGDDASSDWLVALVDRVLAGATVFGSVCSSAVKEGFEAVLGEIYENAMPSIDRIRTLLKDVCVDTVEEVIKKYTLKREKREDMSAEWKLELRERDDEGSYGEVEAAELACERFMHQRRGEFVRALHYAATEMDSELQSLVKKQLDQARGEKGERRMKQENCEDIHPKCEEWADNGECAINPSYMLKFCRISCGVCEGEPTFEKVGEFSLSAASIERLHEKGEELVDYLQEQLCPQISSEGTHSDPIQEIKYIQVLQGKEIEDISRALVVELKGKCLLLYRGWWSYEICFFSKIRQIHYDKDGTTILSSNLIGSFSEQRTVHLHPLILQDEDMEKLGLVGERRAYVMQSYEFGDRCEENNAQRSAVIRLMCSEGLKQAPMSSDSIGVVIHEPVACHYVIHVLLPLMCHYPEYSMFPSVNKEQ